MENVRYTVRLPYLYSSISDKLQATVVEHPLYFSGLSVADDVLPVAKSVSRSGFASLAQSHKSKHTLVPTSIEGEQMILNMKRIEIHEDEEVIDVYYEGKFSISCVKKMQQIDSKPNSTDKKAKGKAPGMFKLSYSYCILYSKSERTTSKGVVIFNKDNC